MFLDLKQRYEAPAIANAFNLWLDIHAPIDLVFRFLTEESGLNRWWTSRCTSEPKPGGLLHCEWQGKKAITGDAIYRQFEPPHRIVVEWTHNNGEPIRRDGKDPRGMFWPALNIYELALIDGNTTRLHLHDMGLNTTPAFEALRLATQKGWIKTMTSMKKVVEQHYRQKMLARQKRKKVYQKEKPKGEE